MELIKRLEVAVVQNLEGDVFDISEQILILLDERNRNIKLLH